MTERTNADRAETGRQMMEAYARSVDCLDGIIPEVDDMLALADLFHYIGQHHSNLGLLINRALSHYDAEITEAA